VKAISLRHLLLLILILGLSACGQATPGTPTEPVILTQVIEATPTPTFPPLPTTQPSPTAQPLPTNTPESTQAPQLSFTAVTYTDATSGFAFDYPADWTLQPSAVIGTRASQAQLFSPGTTAEAIAPGGSRMAITVYLWDPKSDLAAYADHRRSAWTGSGSTILSENSWELSDGRQVMSFVIEGPDKAQAFVLLTTVGENYLELSGEGNLALVDEIAHTLRPLPTQQ
jgi:hypothetical protein